ncbi:hypothetical protein CQA53_08955 [Helicobacter didelphidarum]|uniref:Uncharacterized protein n=1 Tax=Helicobacter didelphidarum TaxID=2040648 RepID=A0A3D8ID07_9HELI|nr:hypothetical protein [Helicobacter didelphidarum]RDU62826.1 hypothetical protein CQA53_08955 [Helicobacter didelphidarum]
MSKSNVKILYEYDFSNELQAFDEITFNELHDERNTNDELKQEFDKEIQSDSILNDFPNLHDVDTSLYNTCLHDDDMLNTQDKQGLQTLENKGLQDSLSNKDKEKLKSKELSKDEGKTLESASNIQERDKDTLKNKGKSMTTKNKLSTQDKELQERSKTHAEHTINQDLLQNLKKEFHIYKEAFIYALKEYLQGNTNIKQVCFKHGIDRVSFYNLIKRFEKQTNLNTKHIATTNKNLLNEYANIIKHINNLKNNQYSFLSLIGYDLEHEINPTLKAYNQVKTELQTIKGFLKDINTNTSE